MTAVLDSSAILAALWREPGGDRVAARLRRGLVSAVNMVEVLTRLIDRGVGPDAAELTLGALGLRVVDFDAAQGRVAAALRPATRKAGLSLGDRACLALGQREEKPVLTADRSWEGLEVGVRIELIR